MNNSTEIYFIYTTISEYIYLDLDSKLHPYTMPLFPQNNTISIFKQNNTISIVAISFLCICVLNVGTTQ
jgi:hypothetical protein